MNGATLERPDVAAYLDAVRSKLADLPAEERDDLVADVEASLLESGDPPALSPEEFAAELREAAGLSSQPLVAASAPSALDALREWLSSERVASWLRTARELAPIWWVARAFVAVGVIAEVWDVPLPVETGGAVSLDYRIVVLLAAAAVSVWLGLRGRRDHGSRRRRLSLVVNIALAVSLLPLSALTLEKYSYSSYPAASYYEPVPGLAVNGTLISNLYPYSRDGKPLFDVLLYDENGYPVDVAPSGDLSRRVLNGRDGTELYNSFPIRYFEPGTTTVAQPTLGPPVAVPEIVTPPLELGSK